MIRHLSKTLDWREAECGHMMVPGDMLPTTNDRLVTCPECINILSRRAEEVPSPQEKMRREWTIAAVGGDTDLGFDDWSRGVGGPTPTIHTPPRMECEATGLVDGVFVFYGTHSDLGGEMEVVPMTTGNVEFTISSADAPGGGLVFNLSHLDRADMIRALLHDFHYSPERGGPNDQD